MNKTEICPVCKAPMEQIEPESSATRCENYWCDDCEAPYRLIPARDGASDDCWFKLAEFEQ